MRKFLAILILCSQMVCAASKTPITFWHSMTGNLGQALTSLVNQYNQSQDKYIIILRYKGNYFETLNTMIAAYRAKQHPDMVQIFEAGTATLAKPGGAIMPLYRIMQLANTSFHPKIFIPAIHGYYADHQGLLAMPFNASTAVLYYNQDAFQRAGIPPSKAPKTWPEVYALSKRLLRAGYSCGFTTTWPSWTQIESFAAWHDIPLANRQNGMLGNADKVHFNHPVLVNHVQQLANWQHEHVFQYGGRADSAQMLFINQHCPMLIQSSGALMSLKSLTQFKLGVAPLPYWPNVRKAPRTTLVGGGAIWAMSGKTTRVYLGIADFVKFLARDDVEFQWQQATGYLPITKNAYLLSKKQRYYERHPGAEVALNELIARKTSYNSRGLRLGNYARIRDIAIVALESAWSGRVPVVTALNTAEAEANLVLERFKKSTRVRHETT